MVSKKKIEGLKKINELLKNYKSILMFDLNNLPSKQLHKIRNKLKEEEIYTLVQKKRILELGLKENNLDLKLSNLKQPAIIYSNKDIFDIVKNLRKLKIKRKAKAGEIADSDIEVEEMNTGIQVGPAISIFKQFKIQTIVKEGKIAIKEKKVVCKKGDTITADMVSLFNMLNIEPVEINISPELGYSENIVYNKEILKLDEDYFKEQIKIAADNLFKVTVYISYPTKQNISLLLQKANKNAEILGLNIQLPVKDLLPELIKIAQLRANKLNNERGQ